MDETRMQVAGAPVEQLPVRQAGGSRSSLALVMAGATVLIAFAGFAPSFYLRTQFGRPPLTSLALVHGLLFSAWMVLFAAQAALVRTGYTAWHRRVGFLAIWLAPAMVVLTLVAQMEQTHMVVAAGMLEQQPLLVNSLSIGGPVGVLIFGGLVAAAMVLRRSPDAHRRLMLLAAVDLMSAPLVRILGFLSLPGSATFLCMDALLVAIVVNDLLAHRWVHRATLWGSLPILLFQASTFTPLYASDAATAYSKWLASFGV